MKLVYYTGWTFFRAITKIFFRIKISGKENFPKNDGFILASNHQSYLDPPVIGSWAPRVVYFMTKAELFENKLLSWYLYNTNARPVKRGVMDRQSIKTTLDIIADGQGMTIFPEGTRSTTGEFLEPKAGIGMIAAKAQCPIIPTYVNGFNRLKDCFLGKMKLTITYGKMIPADWVIAQAKGKEGYNAIAQRVMAEIQKIKEKQLLS